MFSDHQTYELVETLDHPEISDDVATNQKGNLSHLNPPLNGLDKPLIHEPKNLRRTRSLSLFGQILLTIFPLLFISLTAAAISLDNKSTSKSGSIIQQAIALSPTVFPIVFAAIVGRFFRSLGLYWAERSVKLGALGRLIGSQNLFSAIERQVLLRGHYVLGLSIIVIWALSPLGGQSALRLLTVSPEVSSTNTAIRYLPIALSLNTVMSSAFGSSHPITTWSQWGSVFMAAVTTSYQYQNSSQDLFGNVRIPSLDSLSSIANDSWTSVNHSGSIPYSSLLGIPIGGLLVNGTMSFNIISRCFAVQCKSSKHISSIPLAENMFGTHPLAQALGTGRNKHGGSFVVQLTGKGTGPNSNIIDTCNETAVSFNITSMNSASLREDLSFIDCSMEPQDVESSVRCVDRLCKVTAMKKLPWGFDYWQYVTLMTIYKAFHYFLVSISAAAPSGSLKTSSITELWMQFPYATLETPRFTNLLMISLPMLSRNIETLINTYWQSTIGYKYLHGNLHADVTDSSYDNVTADQWQTIDFNTSQALSTRIIGEEYQCNMIFATILIVISGLLVLASLATIALMNATRVPDILGYISSFTRDNPYATFEQASHIDGLERARELREMNMTVGDVNPRGDIGHIAFAATVEVHRLKEDRLYD